MLPALFTLWVRRSVEEPAIWRAQQRARRPRPARPHRRALRAAGCVRLTVALTLMNACTLFAWWGFNLWIPALPLAAGRPAAASALEHGDDVAASSSPCRSGMWFGYVTFGFVSDARRPQAHLRDLPAGGAGADARLRLGARTAAAAAARTVRRLLRDRLLQRLRRGHRRDLSDTTIRATAQGFTYNIGRIASAAAPFAVGSLAETHGFGAALHGRGGRVPPGGGVLVVDSRNAGTAAGVIGRPAG